MFLKTQTLGLFVKCRPHGMKYLVSHNEMNKCRQVQIPLRKDILQKLAPFYD